MNVFAKGRARVPTVATREDRLENTMLRAVSRINTALALYAHTRDEWELINGLVDARAKLEERVP